MRAPAEEATATAGQYYVQAQFAEHGWGSLPNPYHDLGTDLILLPRDLTRLDIGLPLGAQVKTSKNKRQSSYFREILRNDQGEVTGWWYRESSRKHFDYWLSHALPHVLILHDLETSESYWTHVVEPAVKSTGNGAKIFVPADQTIDDAHFDDLLNVAASKPRGPSWEGSAWVRPAAIPAEAALRYALLTPRLVAPHPNDRPESVEPEQAIAMVTQCRFTELDDRRRLANALPHLTSPYPSPEDAAASSDIRWRLYAAMHRYLKSDDNSQLATLIDEVDDANVLAATVAATAATLIETGQPHEALQILQRQQLNENFSTVDGAWLDMHRARCLVELGNTEEAQKIAIRLQDLRPIFWSDPTAIAIVASATVLIFTSAPWSHNVGEAITNTDTAAAWWRSQVVAWGLDRMLDSSFSAWAQQSQLPFDLDARALNDLRSASLMSGFAADQNGWRHAYAQAARYVLQSMTRVSKPNILAAMLTNLRLAGEDDELIAAARRLIQDGPAQVVREVGEAIDFRSSTVTTSLADIKLVSAAADLLNPGCADRYAKWSLRILNRSTTFSAQVQPSYNLRHYVLEMLSDLVPSCSRPVRRHVIRTIVHLPPIKDPSAALGYAAVLSNVRPSDWTSSHIQAAHCRKKDDRLFSDRLNGILAQHDEKARKRLLARAKNGSAQALLNLGDIGRFPPKVVAAQITTQSKLVHGQVQGARGGQFAFGTYSPSHALALLNIYHAEQASWSPIIELMTEPRAHPNHLLRTIGAIGEHAHKIPPAHRPEIIAGLRPLLQRSSPLWPSEYERLKLSVLEAVDALDTSSVPDEQLWRLMDGGPIEKQSLARIIGGRSASENLGTLVLLGHDQNSRVRGEASRWLCRWMVTDVVRNECHRLVMHLANDPGTLVASVIASELRDHLNDPLARLVLEFLEHHVSNTVRLLASGEDR
jgi:hypothetical protein